MQRRGRGRRSARGGVRFDNEGKPGGLAEREALDLAGASCDRLNSETVDEITGSVERATIDPDVRVGFARLFGA